MDTSSNGMLELLVVFILVTLPLLVAIARLNRMIRILVRIENMNMRSLQRWGG